MTGGHVLYCEECLKGRALAVQALQLLLQSTLAAGIKALLLYMMWRASSEICFVENS